MARRRSSTSGQEPTDKKLLRVLDSAGARLKKSRLGSSTVDARAEKPAEQPRPARAIVRETAPPYSHATSNADPAACSPGNKGAIAMLPPEEQARLAHLYEKTREKLLDLTRKNRMLNYSLKPGSRKHLQIVDEVPEEVYRKLADEGGGLDLAFLPDPASIPADEKSEDFIAALDYAKVHDVEYLVRLQALEESGGEDEFALESADRDLRERLRTQLGMPPRKKRAEISRAEHARSLGIDPAVELQPENAKPSHSDKSLQTLKYPDELDRQLAKIADDARLAEQEMGVSTLFLAFGFLEWYESESSEQKSFAPLLLLPVRLEKRRVRNREVFSLKANAESAEANLSLQKFLDRTFGRSLPPFGAEDADEPVSIEAYFSQVREAIDGLKRWHVRRWLVLGHFAFGRFAMYADLNPANWSAHPAGSALVHPILHGAEVPGSDESGPIASDYRIDDPQIEWIAPFLVQDADASQHSALIDVMKKENLVIEGPPGTGKSQTIANIIANALAAGRRVLFLAEKQAALDVVKRRLDQAGLGEMCLELHSDKASPKHVIESLKARMDLPASRSDGRQPSADPVWNAARTEISTYLDALHFEDENRTTPFDLIWRALHGRSRQGDVIPLFKAVEFPGDLIANGSKLDALRAELALFAEAAREHVENHGHPVHSPWTEVGLAAIPHYDAERLIDAVEVLRAKASDLAEIFDELADLGVLSIDDADALVHADRTLGTPPDPDLVGRLFSLDPAEVSRLLDLKQELIAIECRLAMKPDLSGETSIVLRHAGVLMQSGALPALLEMSPSAARREATRAHAESKAKLDCLEEFIQAVRTLGLPEALPCDGLPAIAAMATLAARIDPPSFPWAGRLTTIDEEAFASAHALARMLLAEEAECRRRMRGYGEQFKPDPADLERAAATFRKSGFGRIFASLGGALKSARDLARLLGTPEARAADDFIRLAAHLRSVEAFESNPDLAQLFEDFWHGLATPFAQIAAGISLRAEIRSAGGPGQTGCAVAARMLQLRPEEVVRLGRLTTLASALRRLQHELGMQSDECPLEQAIAETGERLRGAQAFLNADADAPLAHVQVPIREIAVAADLLDERRQIVSKISASSLSEAMTGIGLSDAGVAAARAALDWNAVVRHVTPPALAEALAGPDLVATRERLGKAASSASGRIESYREALRMTNEAFGMSGLATVPVRDLPPRLDALLQRRGEVRTLLVLNSRRRDLDAAGLAAFLACADRIALAPEALAPLFDTLVAERRADRIRRSDPILARQTGPVLDARRKAFIERDRQKIVADRKVIRGRLLEAPVPAGSSAGLRGTWTDRELLRHEATKSRRFTPVRALLRRAGRAVQALKPCFMMSPLSLAKLVAPGALTFDLLVIDEASQMKPEDALGGLLRARQVVVVGDDKQLPPTDFFHRSGDSGSEPDADDDLQDLDDESILSACKTAFRKTRQLKQHYRSRCESLIAFSNREFYKSSLITFPTARPDSFSIDLVPVDGIYQTRRNPIEAARVAEEAVAFMRHHAEREGQDFPSLGIVTLNTDQRDLLQEELRRIADTDDLVRRYRDVVEQRGEPLFVKNLENVQGDERDVIFVSLTYGPAAKGAAMAQRFGPINGKHGGRRLNVLFSRARLRIGLFASFRAADVRVSETSSDGVKALQRYLAYVEGRGRGLGTATEAAADSPFEVEVAERLQARGYSADPQVGVSGFRIDLGVRHPDIPGVYLAGVECDGARYHSNRSARDRDRLREEILTGLGWNIVRVWSTDWFDDPDGETDKLVRKLEALRASPRPDTGAGAWRPSAGVSRSPAEPIIVPEPVSELITAVPSGESDVAALLTSDAPLSEEDAIRVLEHLREAVIAPSIPNWQRHRSILRDGMIETFVRQRIAEPQEWIVKAPHYQRINTNPQERNLFLPRICEIVERIG